jgi:hypothetical protein
MLLADSPVWHTNWPSVYHLIGRTSYHDFSLSDPFRRHGVVHQSLMASIRHHRLPLICELPVFGLDLFHIENLHNTGKELKNDLKIFTKLLEPILLLLLGHVQTPLGG